MKTKKPKRRYLTANEIRDQIDLQKAKAIKLQQTAESLDLVYRELIKIPNMVEDAKYKALQAYKMRRKAQRIYAKKLPYLSKKLAEFMTDPMPGVIPDRSVEA